MSTTDTALLANRNADILGASLTLLALPTIFVILRLLSRWMSRAGFWVFSWGPNIIQIYGYHHGLGHHLETLPPDAVFGFFKYLYPAEFLYSVAMASVKYSIILFQYRIFPIVQFRRILMYCGAFVVAFTTSSVITYICQCSPIDAFWTTLAGTLPGHSGSCIKVKIFLLTIGAINTATDFALLVLPIPILWRLKTGTPQKLMLTGIFIMGMVVCAVSIIRLVKISQFRSPDVTYYYVDAIIWTAAEPSIAVVSACIPSLRPLFVRLIWGGAYRPRPLEAPAADQNYSWRSGSKVPHDRSFNRLQDGSGDESGKGAPWRTNVSVHGGRVERNSDEAFELGSQEGETPINRIRAKTTVVLTISERVDWQIDLF
ncbi:hypothetical protein P7C71_g3261, partial [Lecanoromycetidae sp. Uapishka_2]